MCQCYCHPSYFYYHHISPILTHTEEKGTTFNAYALQKEESTLVKRSDKLYYDEAYLVDP
jgi:hypothetical protein